MRNNLVNAILEEYKALRAEVLLCLERRTTIISWGLAGIGAFMTAAVTAYASARFLLTGFLLLIVTTTTCWFVVHMWLTETRRARRASHYLCYLEKKLAAVMGVTDHPLPLEWEQSLRRTNGGTRFAEHYSRTVGFFGLISFASGFFGIINFVKGVEIAEKYSTGSVVQPQICLLLFDFLVAGVVSGWVVRAVRQAQWLKNEFSAVPQYPPPDDN